jgi:transketolase
MFVFKFNTKEIKMLQKVEFEDLIFSNDRKEIPEYQKIANQLRRDIIKSLTLAKSGHSGGPLGISDIMSVLYFGGYMKYDPKNPELSDRDRFVLSAGHMAPILYSVLARAGYFPVDELKTLRKLGTRLQGHPGRDVHLPGIETSSGSLGQGVSIAVGMAMCDKFADKSSKKVFCVTGDGELQEGAVWEAAMCAGTYKLNNLCWIVDNNDCQIDGRVKDIMSIYPLKEKFEAFNFETIVIDGHNYTEIIRELDNFTERAKQGDAKPTCIIAKTYMGKGVSFMHDQYKWHGVPPNPEQAETALNELQS